MNDNISGWNEWSQAFEHWSDVTISELHGLMTGLMTVCHAPNDTKVWQTVLEELSFSVPDEPALELLSQEAEDVSFALKDKDDAYQYTPLVPDDEHDLYDRLMALKHWANGLMTGIGVADLRLTKQEEEMLADLAKIGGIRIEPDDEFEGGEASYLELFEFARMIPVSLAIRPRKAVMELPLIAGLPLHAKTAHEQAQQTHHSSAQDTLPFVIDAMNYDRPS